MAKGTAAAVAPAELDAAARLRVAITRLSRRLSRTGSELPLTATEMAVLSTTARKGPIGLGRLAADEALNPTMLSRIVRSLEAAGLVAREEDPDDRRAASLALSAKGRRLVERIRTERADALNGALDRLGGDERARLLEALPLLEALAEELRGDRP